MKHAISFASFFAVAVYSARGTPGTDGGVSAVYTGVQQDIGSVYCVYYTLLHIMPALLAVRQNLFSTTCRYILMLYIPRETNKAPVYIKPYFAGWF